MRSRRSASPWLELANPLPSSPGLLALGALLCLYLVELSQQAGIRVFFVAQPGLDQAAVARQRLHGIALELPALAFELIRCERRRPRCRGAGVTRKRVRALREEVAQAGVLDQSSFVDSSLDRSVVEVEVGVQALDSF
jgi:hypothetical protein